MKLTHAHPTRKLAAIGQLMMWAELTGLPQVDLDPHCVAAYGGKVLAIIQFTTNKAAENIFITNKCNSLSEKLKCKS